MRDDGFTCYDLACFLFALTLLLLYGNFAMLFFLLSRFCQATFVRIFTTIGSLTRGSVVVVYTQKTFYCMPGKSGMRKEGKKELVMNVVFCLTLEIFF